MNQPPYIFTRFLTALEVPHTREFSDATFRGMTFKSLFGLSHLLKEYGIDNEGVRVADKTELTSLTPPFLARTSGGVFVIVKEINPTADRITYDSLGETENATISDFIRAWDGVALLAYPDAHSREPDYKAHHLTETVRRLSSYTLIVIASILFLYCFITRKIYSHFSTILITVFDCIGLWFSYMLMQKSLNIHTSTSEKVCGVLEHGGCDTVISLKASKLFGVFSWSEVGFGYFGISLLTLLFFPHALPTLGLCTLCCLPYTMWSIWYQKFRARHWCTLCVGVQSILWILFFCYLGGGWLSAAFHSGWHEVLQFMMLTMTYVFAVMLINRSVNILIHAEPKN